MTKNFGETFSNAGDFIKAFYWDYKEVGNRNITRHIPRITLGGDSALCQ